MGLSAFLLLLTAPQDAKKSAADLDPMRRAAIVDQVMAEPSKPKLARPAPVEELPPVRRLDVTINRTTARRALVLEPKGPEPGDGPQPAAFAGRIRADDMALASDNFDRWLFADDADETTRRARLDSLLAVRIERALQSRPLAADQVRKLRLAGRGDVKRLFDQVAAKRAEFASARKDYREGRGVLVQLEGLSQDFRIGPFYGESLFAKTLRKIDEDRRAARPGPD